MNVLITGATDGHGRALADRLADHDLLLHGRRPDALRRAADEVTCRSPRSGRPRSTTTT